MNKMDRVGANFLHSVQTMHDRLSATSAIPIQLPLGQEGDHAGVIDLVEMKAYRYLDEAMGSKYEIEEIPADMKEDAQKAHDLMIEKVAEAAHEAGDDVLFEKYVAGEADGAEVKKAIRTARLMTPSR
jgi:elongation factor G